MRSFMLKPTRRTVAARIIGPSSLLPIRGQTPVRGKVLRQVDSEGAAPLRSTGQPLPVEDRAFMERRFGYDFSKVRVHADSEAAVLAERLDASAYTTGSDIVFGRHQYKGTGSDAERRLQAHELTHVIQQSFVPQAVQLKPKTPTKQDTVTIASVYDLIKAKNPDLAKLVTPLTLATRRS